MARGDTVSTYATSSRPSSTPGKYTVSFPSISHYTGNFCRFRTFSKPIASYGIIAFKRYPLRFLLIQRKDSIGYLDFIRGRYTDNAPTKTHVLQNIKILIEEMTPQEIQRLLSCDFRTLWDALWINHQCRAYTSDFPEAQAKFAKLKLNDLLDNIHPKWNRQEYGLPKGRRNGRESDLSCAMREFEEETGLKPGQYTIQENLTPIQEIFTGSNGKSYRHVYFFAELNDDAIVAIDQKNIVQMSEVRNIGLFPLREALKVLREYDVTKRSILIHAYDYILAGPG